ncbi:PTS sugar transporter subunit IIA [Lipingzhangella sp. LS1_29]|uniref:Ascorbate-specific PTS system EIIA component n=1 Tax=Lipingzhangella rawalii TaxID=2055835 RepID=A0ABU2H8I6_9ACTN|nr:PTS sugar transporter subunit IIA [Lipingzhangella rawalii]MDS1271628.1 PTS sugar transporter subunit IIA [Lipingzhangella rawalii]
MAQDSPNVTWLSDLRDPARVQARRAVADWREAVSVSGELLVRAGVCTEDYVTEMSTVIREHGPYIVVAPGIALPHARPGAGVLRPGLALVTLETPVLFGHDSNDPVDLLVPFAVTEPGAHTAALRELALLLSNADTVDRMRAADCDASLLTTLQTVI